MNIEVTASGQSCGAEVRGVDLSRELAPTLVAQIREAWLQHQVLSFPGQSLSDDDLERFTLCFGPFGDDPFIAPITGRKHIIAVQRDAGETTSLFAEQWHSDWSFQAHPPQGTCLYGVTIPPTGGDPLPPTDVNPNNSAGEAPVVPEPGRIVLLSIAMGVGGVGYLRRRAMSKAVVA